MVASKFHSRSESRRTRAGAPSLLAATVSLLVMTLIAASTLIGPVSAQGSSDSVGVVSVDGVWTECVDAHGVVSLSLTNQRNTARTFRIVVGSMAPRTLRLGPGVGGTMRVGGIDDGNFPITVSHGGSVLYSSTVQIDCDVRLAAAVVTSCLSGKGRFDFALTNNTTKATRFDVEIPGLPVRSRAVPANSERQVTVTGRDNGAYALRVSVDGETILATTADVLCDVTEVAVTVGCLGGRGRIDVHLHNPESGTSANRTYTVVVGTVTPRTKTVASGATRTVTVTGRPAGPVKVSVTGAIGGLFERVFDVACGAVVVEPAEPSTPTEVGSSDSSPQVDADGVGVTTQCLGGNGRVNVAVANTSAASRSVSAKLEGLATRTEIVAPGSTAVFTFTGRADGPYEVTMKTGSAATVTRSIVVFCDGAEFEAQSLAWVNDFRSRRGVAPLESNVELDAAARFWSEQMVATSVLDHDCCAGDRLPGNMTTWAELVGRGETGLSELHLAFEQSPAHAGSLVDGRYDQVGFGFASDGVGLWVTIYLGAS